MTPGNTAQPEAARIGRIRILPARHTRHRGRSSCPLPTTARPSGGRWLDREQVGALGQLAVAARRAAESPAHPRGRVIARPADVLAAGGQPLGLVLGPVRRAQGAQGGGRGSGDGGSGDRGSGDGGSGDRGARQSPVTGTPSTSQARRATRRWPSVVRCSRSGLQARVSLSTRMDHRSTRSHPRSSAMPRRCMLYAAIRPRSSRITGNMRGSKPVKMSTRQPAACSWTTADSNSAASMSTSVRRRMSFPPAARLTSSGAHSTARGNCSATTSPSSLPRMARLA